MIKELLKQFGIGSKDREREPQIQNLLKKIGQLSDQPTDGEFIRSVLELIDTSRENLSVNDLEILYRRIKTYTNTPGREHQKIRFVTNGPILDVYSALAVGDSPNATENHSRLRSSQVLIRNPRYQVNAENQEHLLFANIGHIVTGAIITISDTQQGNTYQYSLDPVNLDIQFSTITPETFISVYQKAIEGIYR
jgi:hypothetical protein